MLKILKNATFFIVVALVVSGCTTRLGDFTVASSQNVRNLEYGLSGKGKTTVSGESCIHTVVIFPIGSFNARIQRAMDDAIKNGQAAGIDGDILVNARIDNSAWVIPLIYGQNCITVSGDLVTLEK